MQIKTMDTAWRKGVRRLLKLPYQSHSMLLPGLVKGDCFVDMIRKRTINFIKSGLASDNNIASYVFNTSCFLRSGTIGSNFNILCNLLHVSLYDFKNESSAAMKRRIENLSQLDGESRYYISILNELIDWDYEIPGFHSERNDYIDILSTM